MGLRGWALFLAGLLLLAFIFSHPLALHLRSGMPYSFLPVPGLELLHQHPGDYLQLMYRFWLFEKALEGRTAFFSNAFEFSTPRTPPTFVTQGIPISFLFMLFMPLGNIAAYNALVVLSFLAAGAAMALLVSAVTGSPGAAAACGLLYACVPYRLGHLYGGHIGGFVFFLPPLALYCIERGFAAGGGGRNAFRWGLACGLCVLSTAMTELHISFYLAPLLCVYFAVSFAALARQAGRPAATRTALRILGGLLLPAAASVAYLLWVRHAIIAPSSVSGGRTLKNVQAFSPLLGDLLRKSPNAEKNIYPGYAALLLALWGILQRRREIARGRAEGGALLLLYFWVGLCALGYLLALGTTLEARVPVYGWLHARVPFLAFSRTPSRILCLALPALFVLCGFGLRAILSRGRPARGAAFLLVFLALADYHPKRPIGISILRGMDRVYETVRREAQGKRLLDLPIWPGDSAWSAIYEYYATLTGVPIVNGYNPVPRQRYVTEVFEPLRSLNVGELRAAQHALLRDWNVSHIVLHQDLFPRKVSRYPFRFTLRNLLDSPYLRFVMQEGPNHLFEVLDAPSGPPPAFCRRSPVGNLYPARSAGYEVGRRIQDAAASGGRAIAAVGRGEPEGMLFGGVSRFYPTGAFRVWFNLKLVAPPDDGPAARLKVYDVGKGRTIAARELSADEFGAPGGYRLFDLSFVNQESARIEFRVQRLGGSGLRADFAYVLFDGEEDPRPRYEAEDLYHIGRCIEDAAASGGHAVEISREEDPHMPMASGPERLYPPGEYRARFMMEAEDADEGSVALLAASSSFGDTLASRELAAADLRGPGRYRPQELEFTLDRLTPLQFSIRHFNRARLRFDAIEIERR